MLIWPSKHNPRVRGRRTDTPTYELGPDTSRSSCCVCVPQRMLNELRIHKYVLYETLLFIARRVSTALPRLARGRVIPGSNTGREPAVLKVFVYCRVLPGEYQDSCPRKRTCSWLDTPTRQQFCTAPYNKHIPAEKLFASQNGHHSLHYLIN
jgi:hypothetical protein